MSVEFQFPEVMDDKVASQVVSPLDAIIREIRRNNVGAAAAAAGPQMSILDANEPGLSAEQQLVLAEDTTAAQSADPGMATCSTCHNRIPGTRRRMSLIMSRPANRRASFSYSSPQRMAQRRSTAGSVGSESSIQDDNYCPECGRERGTSSQNLSTDGFNYMLSKSPGKKRFKTWIESVRTERVESPQHARALLQTTPHLRIMSEASTDMQGSIGAPPNNLMNILSPRKPKGRSRAASGDASSADPTDYPAALARDRANQHSAAELTSLLWVLAHELSLEDYDTLENEVFNDVFALVHSQKKELRIAGFIAMDNLIDAPSTDEDKKAIRFANNLSHGLRTANGDFELVAVVSKALGHLAQRTANVDIVESEVSRTLEWLRTDRSDRRLAACLALSQFAIHAPTTFYSKTSHSILGAGGSNEFLSHIFESIRDPQPIVRACAVDALSRCLRVLMERSHGSLTSMLCQVHFSLLEGLDLEVSKKNRNTMNSRIEAAQHGSLLVVGTMMAETGDFMLPRYDEICRKVLEFAEHPKALIRLEVIHLLPRLARRSPLVFARRYLESSLDFLLESATETVASRQHVDLRPSAFLSIGLLVLAMSDPNTGEVLGGDAIPTVKISNNKSNPEGGLIVQLDETGCICQNLDRIFALVSKGLKHPTSSDNKSSISRHVAAFHCAADLVEALGDMALPFIPNLIDDMFRAGLSNDLIQCLHAIAESIPEQRRAIQDRLLEEVSLCLAGRKSARMASEATNIIFTESDAKLLGVTEDELDMSNYSRREVMTDIDRIRILTSKSTRIVNDLVLSLQTLGMFGDALGRVATSEGVVPLLPFVQNVVAQYLTHPLDKVRMAAVLTCCALLVPPGIFHRNRIGGFSANVIESVLRQLLRVAVADTSPVVRLCVVRALDERYAPFLSQAHNLQSLFLLLQDELLATRVAGVQLLGRLAELNPAPVLPYMRKFLLDIIIELECSVDSGKGREEATRLLVVLLRAKSMNRLVGPVLHPLVKCLPLVGGTPRLSAVALEALGELAKAAGASLQPWVTELIPIVLNTLQDQRSASKQKTSLRTLSLIAGSTGYVIQPYIDYPKLLSRATDIMPGTKRAPWALRREVIRTLGVLGALDPAQYHLVAPKARKRGAVGGAYFTVQDVANTSKQSGESIEKTEKLTRHQDDDLPAHLFMYEQYAMVSQPVSRLPPARRMTPKDEDFYQTVVVQALMRMFRDPSLAIHHGAVMQAILLVFKALGLRCVPFLPRVVPHILQTIRTSGPSNLSESLLKQVVTLSGIVKEHLRPYVEDIFRIVEQFWMSRHLGTIFSLVLHIAAGVPDEFRKFVPDLVRIILGNFDEIHVGEFRSQDLNIPKHVTDRLRLILSNIKSLCHVLSEHRQVLVSAILSLTDSLVPYCTRGHSLGRKSEATSLVALALEASRTLLEGQGSGIHRCGFPVGSASAAARAIQPLIRLLGQKCRGNKLIGHDVIETLCVCARQLGQATWMNSYHRLVHSTVQDWQRSVHDPRSETDVGGSRDESGLKLYENMVEGLTRPASQLYGLSLPRSDFLSARREDSLMLSPDPQPPVVTDNPQFFDQQLEHPDTHSNNQKTNQDQLKKAWDVSQCVTRDDWDAWMRRLAIQLLREAPDPALRAAADLAHAYQPLARELFSAAFVACWRQLNKSNRLSLVQALKTAFVGDVDVSPEILQTLLNLAEFMEHGSGDSLPIDIGVLAELALKCRAYAKALHYKEQEHSRGGTSSCVETLISVNRKLDLPEAALGVLKSATMELGDGQSEPDRRSFSMDFAHQHQTSELFYSVVWSTTDSITVTSDLLNLGENKELWLAKLGAWNEALLLYQEKWRRNPNDFDALLGCMRCLSARGEWRQVLDLADESWSYLVGRSSKSRDQKKALRMCADAAWRLGHWDDLEKYSSELVFDKGSMNFAFPPAGSASHWESPFAKVEFDGAFFSAVLHIHRKEWTMAEAAIDAARKAMDGRFTALMAESYNRAYPSMVTAQTLAEMEEIIDFKKLYDDSSNNGDRFSIMGTEAQEARNRLLSVWRDRLAGCRMDADVHSSILAVRSLVLGPVDEVDATLTLSELSREAQRFKLAERTILDPLEALGANLEGPTFGFGVAESLELRANIESACARLPLVQVIGDLVVNESQAFFPQYNERHRQFSQQLVNSNGGLERLRIQHRLYFAFVKHLWITDRRDEATERLTRLCDVVDLVSHCETVGDNSLRVACWVELGEWKIDAQRMPEDSLPQSLQVDVLSAFKRAVSMDNCGYKAWHAWALLNFRLALQLNARDDNQAVRSGRVRFAPSSETQKNHVITAVKGFVKAIGLGTKSWTASVQQDMLNLLTCLFQYGEQSAVATVLSQWVDSVAVDTWLGVLPQLLARIHIRSPSIRNVLHPLLVRLGEKHPQALIYPLSVLLKSPGAERKTAAEVLMNSLRAHSSALVEEALLVSTELIRVAILWLETWHVALEEAARVYHGEGNVAAMFDWLLDLHVQVESGTETAREAEFASNFGEKLREAHGYLQEYQRLMTMDGGSIPTGQRNGGDVDEEPRNEEAETKIARAWNIYYIVFRSVNKQLPQLTKLHLGQCSPALSRAKGLELGVPGSYKVDGSCIKIQKFYPDIEIITSKQRPRKIKILGNDGQDYVFLLKGHEDLRQDERVMQLFGLVNALLERDRQTKTHDLYIHRYAITPLSQNCGLVGWVPHTVTLHSLIRDYRASKDIVLNLEQNKINEMAPDHSYELLPAMRKVEIFSDALRDTPSQGNDLYEILWLNSTNSEEWLERRTKFTRSLAVMSMVGYILGLGDRHPSNLMLDELSGRVLHIDLGDCFEAAMIRDKFPEKVPFRLTRMLIKAMEVSGIEGSYRSTCERTMTVLRENHDSIVTLLEAFVYDPLVSWRLVGEMDDTGNDTHISRAMESTPGSVPANNTIPQGDEPNDIVPSNIVVDMNRSMVLHEAIEEENDEDENTQGEAEEPAANLRLRPILTNRAVPVAQTDTNTSQIFQNIQLLAASVHSNSRIASLVGNDRAHQVAVSYSLSRSRLDSFRQREIMNRLDENGDLAHEEALNEKALKIIRRVQDKLTGTDFPELSDQEPLDVVDQVQRLIVQATSVENLCQLFVGWCAFW
eukprot:Nitzschia sp. Nitz4//scaffold14_size191712//162960//172475//NITZ4_001752-RA/size191712-snap-gene-0.144-mRNA-1//1//CDS//3329537014//121//frame0